MTILETGYEWEGKMNTYTDMRERGFAGRMQRIR